MFWAQRSFQNHHQTFHDRCPEKIGPLPKKSDHWSTRTCPENIRPAPTWSPPMSRFKKLSKVRCQQPLVCWHGSVAFPILPIHIANLSRLSKCTLPIISIPKPLKLSNSLSWTSYPIWQMSILMFAWRVSDNQYCYVPMHFWIVMGDDMQ